MYADRQADLTTVVEAWRAGKNEPNNPPKLEPTPQPVPLRPTKKGEAPTIILGRVAASPARAAVDPAIAAQAAAVVAEANRWADLREQFAKSADDFNRRNGF